MEGDGRKLPPEETRWKKGVSGNPKGRPKKEDSMTSLLKEMLETPCPVDREGRTWRELFLLSNLQQAIKGNPAARKDIWERSEGKVPQKQQDAGAAGEPILIEVVHVDKTRGS
jgi:hypothetical protein